MCQLYLLGELYSAGVNQSKGVYKSVYGACQGLGWGLGRTMPSLFAGMPLVRIA